MALLPYVFPDFSQEPWNQWVPASVPAPSSVRVNPYSTWYEWMNGYASPGGMSKTNASWTPPPEPTRVIANNKWNANPNAKFNRFPEPLNGQISMPPPSSVKVNPYETWYEWIGWASKTNASWAPAPYVPKTPSRTAPSPQVPGQSPEASQQPSKWSSANATKKWRYYDPNALNVSTSIVDYMKSQNLDSSIAARWVLAHNYGIKNYQGTKKQNIELMKRMLEDN